jgi:hypothetical protein
MTERGVADDSKPADAAPSETKMKAASGRKRPSSRAKDEGQVSQALRTVYQRAIDEDIPSEMLDLLKKLD